MRTLKSKDLFAALRVVKEIDVKEEVLRISSALMDGSIDSVDTDELKKEVGLELMLGILGNCGTEKAEKAVFDFLAGPLEKPAPDLRETDLLELMEMIKKMIEMNDGEKWKAFFTSLSALIRKSIS